AVGASSDRDRAWPCGRAWPLRAASRLGAGAWAAPPGCIRLVWRGVWRDPDLHDAADALARTAEPKIEDGRSPEIEDRSSIFYLRSSPLHLVILSSCDLVTADSRPRPAAAPAQARRARA